MEKISQRVTLHTDEAQCQRDLENYRQMAIQSGAAKAAVVM